jgi:hypothetical protein
MPTSDQQETFENRMTAVEKRMRAQYTALDTQMAKMNQLSQLREPAAVCLDLQQLTPNAQVCATAGR